MTNANVQFMDGEWWYTGASDGNRRRLDAHKRKNDTRMFVNGRYIPKTHPLHKPGRYEGFEEAAFSGLQNYKTSSRGQVYVITNPAFEGWVKVGMAVEASDRLNNYQTSSPFRDYVLQSFLDVADRREAEATIHQRLSKRFERQGEWFKCSVADAVDEFIGYQMTQEK